MSKPIPPERTLIVAGATGYGVWPANTLEGVRACLAAPVDGIEIDVQMTADGQVIAHHDYRLDPDATRRDGVWLETPGPPIKTLTLAELRRFDVGRLRPESDEARRHPGRADIDGAHIPTLTAIMEMLAAAAGPPRLLYVEIKTDPTHPEVSPDPAAVVAAVIGSVEAVGWTAHAKIIAFDWRVLRLSQARNPDIATAHLTIPRPPSTSLRDSPWADGFDPWRHGDSVLAAIEAHGGMEWSPYFTDVTEARLAEARALGLRVGPWGLAEASDIARMQQAAVFSATVSGPDWTG